MKVFMKFSALTPAQLHRLHDVLKSDKVRATRVGSIRQKNKKDVFEPSVLVKIIKAQLTENGRYTVTIESDTMARGCDSQDPSQKNLQCRVTRQVISAVLDAIEVFPDVPGGTEVALLPKTD